MKLTLIRHTQVAVLPGICYGQSDVGLAKSYPAERDRVSGLLRGAAFEKVFSSPLSRCHTLAKDLFPGHEIVLDERLKELNFGQWEMLDWESIAQTPEGKAWFDDFVAVACPGGESFNDQINRVAAFLDELKGQDLRSVAVVTHGGVVRSTNCLLNGIAPLDAFKARVDYGKVVSFNLSIDVLPRHDKSRGTC